MLCEYRFLFGAEKICQNVFLRPPPAIVPEHRFYSLNKIWLHKLHPDISRKKNGCDKRSR
jgi:hypothetical protein